MQRCSGGVLKDRVICHTYLCTSPFWSASNTCYRERPWIRGGSPRGWVLPQPPPRWTKQCCRMAQQWWDQGGQLWRKVRRVDTGRGSVNASGHHGIRLLKRPQVLFEHSAKMVLTAKCGVRHWPSGPNCAHHLTLDNMLRMSAWNTHLVRTNFTKFIWGTINSICKRKDSCVLQIVAYEGSHPQTGPAPRSTQESCRPQLWSD